MGPFHGMSDSERAADALIKGKMELNPRVKILEQTADHHKMKLTCIDSKNIWIIHSINCQQVANDLEEMTSTCFLLLKISIKYFHEEFRKLTWVS